MKFIYPFFFLLLIPVFGFSQQSSDKESWPCPNPEFMGGSLCNAISGRTKDSTGKHLFYYQRIVHEAACVLDTDTEEEKIRKIQKMWKDLEGQIICDNLSFSVHKGSAIKFAIDSLNDDFIFDVTYVWKVDLNHVDKSDNRTVLDFVSDEIERHKGRAIESSLRGYHGQLRAAGAKYKHEL